MWGRIARVDSACCVLARRHRVGHEAVGEPCPVLGYPVDVWRLYEMVVVGTDSLIRVVIAHDVDNVHWLVWRLG